jgi:hypothetical protein
MYQSLFEYLRKPAGPELGKRVYAEAKRRRIKVSPRQVNTRKYKGTILTYPVSFLDSYLPSLLLTLPQINYYNNPYVEATESDLEPEMTAPKKKSLLENLY